MDIDFPRGRGLILLADSDVMLRNLSRSTLAADGYSVLSAADGPEALLLAQTHQHPIDLLLTAALMPRASGLSLYQELAANQPGFKVLFLSNAGSGQLGLPPSLPYLVQPFQPPALLAKVNEILSGHPLSGAPSAGDLKVILVVDHNHTRGERTKNILVGAGYAVLTAGSVEEAEALSDSVAKIDLVVSGVIFPGQSGVHLAEHVEASPREISTLLVSHFHPDLLHNTAGFSRQPEFLPNPFTPEALLTRVRRLLDS